MPFEGHRDVGNGDGGAGALREGALLVVGAAEAAYRIEELDAVLKPWVRERVEVLAGLLRGADSLREVAEDSARLARTAADYSTLREELRADLRESGPEPPWRVVERGVLAVRALSRVRLPQPGFVLRKTAVRVGPVAAASRQAAEKGAPDWEFTVIPANTAADDGPYGTFALRVPGGFHGAALHPVHVPPELAAQPAWCLQLEYGFRALGLSPFLTVPQE